MEKIKKIFKGYCISLAGFGILSFGGALLLMFTPFPEKWSFMYLIILMTAVSMFTGFYMADCFQKAGVLTGLFFSAVLVFLILLLTALSFSRFLETSMLRPIYLIPLGAGMAGGILGANMKN